MEVVIHYNMGTTRGHGCIAYFRSDSPIADWISKHVVLRHDHDTIQTDDLIRLKELINIRLISNPTHFNNLLTEECAEEALKSLKELLLFSAIKYFKVDCSSQVPW